MRQPGLSGLSQPGLSGLSQHVMRLSAHSDPLEELGRIVDCEAFRTSLLPALASGDGAKDRRQPYEMLKVLILPRREQPQRRANGEYLIRDRLSWLRFLGFDLGRRLPVPTRSGSSARS